MNIDETYPGAGCIDSLSEAEIETLLSLVSDQIAEQYFSRLDDWQLVKVRGEKTQNADGTFETTFAVGEATQKPSREQ